MRTRFGSLYHLGRRYGISADRQQRSVRERGGRPFASSNFVTSHDRITLYDMMSYNQKHVELWWGRPHDGCRDPCPPGAAGAELLGHPPLLAGGSHAVRGDEILRTQQGNNNAYCQDNEISWFDWSLDRSRGDLLAFTRSLMGGRLYMVERGDDRGKSGEHSGRG